MLFFLCQEPKQEKSKSVRRPGPKSKLSKTNETPQKKTPKAGPASKMKKNGTTNKNSSNSDSDSDFVKKPSDKEKVNDTDSSIPDLLD